MTSWRVAIPVLALLWTALGNAPVSAGDPGFTVKVVGSGPDVILVPGLASSRDIWAGEAARLQDKHRLHLIQINGFADGPGAPDATPDDPQIMQTVANGLSRYIDAEGLKHPAVIGHSLGGEIGLMLAAAHPNQVDRIMVVDALPLFPLIFDPDATVATAAPYATRMRDALLAESQAKYAAGASATAQRLVKSPIGRAEVTAATAASDHATVARAAFEGMTTDLRPVLHQIRAKATILYAWDAAYGILPADIDALYATAYASLADKSLQRVDNSFHFIMYDQPDAFAAAVNCFLQ